MSSTNKENARPSVIVAAINELNCFRRRKEARKKLAHYGDKCEDALIDVLRDPNAKVNGKWAAMKLLATMKSQKAVPFLLDIMRDNANLNGDATRALYAITGKEIGEDYHAWNIAAGVAVDDTAPNAAQARACMNILSRTIGGTALEMEWDQDGYARVVMPIGNRSHQLLISFDNTDVTENAQVSIYTECGPATAIAKDIIAKHNTDKAYGTFSIEKDAETGADKVVLRHSVSTTEFDVAAAEILPAIATNADMIENALTGTDRI